MTSSTGEKWSDSASYGERVAVDIEVPESGEYTFSVQLANSYGTSPIVKSTIWIGYDMPEALSPKAVYSDGTATISWQHPACTLHNRIPIDPADMTYRVTRFPDNVLIGETASTSITDCPPLPESNLISYYYSVTGIYACGGDTYESEPASTGNIVLGTALLPYENNFENEAMMSHFTIVDADNDGATWIYNKESGSVYAAYGDWVPKDDWLVSPAFSLEEGKNYFLKVDVASMGDYNPEELEIVLLSDISPEAGVATILERMIVNNSIFNGYRSLEVVFKAPVSGPLYVGLHAVSDEYSYYLYVDNFRLSDGIDRNAPAVPDEIKIIPAPDGSASVAITGLAPVKNFAGEAISSPVDIIVYRDGEFAHKASGVAPGDKFEITDNPTAGRHTYRILASNEYGEGASYEMSAFVGVNCPKAPEGIVMFEDSEIPGRVHIGWEAPTEDAFGQPLDQASLRYTIMDIYGNVVDENITDCSYTVDALPTGLDKIFARFAIYAINEVGVSEVPGYTAMKPVGFPFEGGWQESFADGALSSMIGSAAINITDNVQWTPMSDTPEVSAADNDNGFVAMQAADLGLAADLITPKCSVGSNYHLDFSWNGVKGSDNTIQVYAVNGMVENLLKEVTIGSAEGWQNEVIALDNYEGKDVHFIFRGTAVSDREIQLDCLSLSDTLNSIEGVDIAESNFVLTTGEGWLSVNGSCGASVSIYTLDGRKLITIDNADGQPIATGSGVFIVRCGERAAKVVVK